MKPSKYPPGLAYPKTTDFKELHQLYPHGVPATLVNTAWQNIQEFFEDWPLYDFKIQMWDLLKNAMAYETSTTTGLERVNQMYLYEKVCSVMDDLHQLYVNELLRGDGEKTEQAQLHNQLRKI